MHWLRNMRQESDGQKELRTKYKHIAYPDQMFYDTHKITIGNFLEKLEQSENPQSLIDKLFDDESHRTGRRGVKNLKQGVDLVK